MDEAGRTAEPGGVTAALAPVLEAFSPMMLFGRRSGEVVGRRTELDAIRQQILASKTTAADGRFPISDARTVTLRGTSEEIEIVTVDWS